MTKEGRQERLLLDLFELTDMQREKKKKYDRKSSLSPIALRVPCMYLKKKTEVLILKIGASL